MLPGVVSFPPEYARLWREKGYWRDKSLAEEFASAFRLFKERIFLVYQILHVLFVISVQLFKSGNLV